MRRSPVDRRDALEEVIMPTGRQWNVRAGDPSQRMRMTIVKRCDGDIAMRVRNSVWSRIGRPRISMLMSHIIRGDARKIVDMNLSTIPHDQKNIVRMHISCAIILPIVNDSE